MTIFPAVWLALLAAVAWSQPDGPAKSADDFEDRLNGLSRQVREIKRTSPQRQDPAGDLAGTPAADKGSKDGIPLKVPAMGWPELEPLADSGKMTREDARQYRDFFERFMPGGMSSEVKAVMRLGPTGKPHLHLDYEDKTGFKASATLVCTDKEFLWLREQTSGRVAGRKDKSCVILRNYSPKLPARWQRLDYMSSNWRMDLDLKAPGGMAPKEDVQDGTLLPDAKGWDPRAQGWKPVVDFAAIEKAARKGSAYLLELQGEDGAWGVHQSPDRNGLDNDFVRVGITAIVIDALERYGQGGSEAVKRGYRFIERMGLAEESDLSSRPAWNTRPYALAFGLEAVLKLKKRTGDSKYDRQVEAYVEAIRKMQGASGGLKYGSGSPGASTFQLAFLAMSLADAEAAGYKLPANLLNDLLKPLTGSRQAYGGFPYYAGTTEDDEGSTAARSVQIEYALNKANRSSQERLREAALRFLRYRDGLKERVGQKEDPTSSPHQGPHLWAHYYYLFGNYWTARVLNELGDPDACAMANDVGGLVSELENRRGLVDSETYGGPAYGTATLLLTLADVQDLIQRAWPDLKR